jgi:hypothetical protein
MPEGGAYVWDAWRTTQDSNPNIDIFVRFHANYGLNEGGSGRATVLDHPLHISLFEGNFRSALPPHERTLATPPRLLPPHAITPVYPQVKRTVLRRTFGDVSRLHLAGAYRGGITHAMAFRVHVEESPPTSDMSDSGNESDSGPNNPTDSFTSLGSPPPTSPEPPAQSYSDNHPQRPYNANTTRYLDMGTPSTPYIIIAAMILSLITNYVFQLVGADYYSQVIVTSKV